MNAERSSTHPALWMGLLLEATTIPVALGLAPLLDVQLWGAFQLNWEHVALGAASAGPLLIAYAALRISSADWVREIHARIQEVLLPLFRESGLRGVAALAVLAGVGEELLFRGVLQEGLTRPLGTAAGLAMASALFGAVHWITSAYALIAAGMGLYLGGLYLWTGNLLVPMIAHALYDFIALCHYLKVQPRRNPPRTAPKQQAEKAPPADC